MPSYGPTIQPPEKLDIETEVCSIGLWSSMPSINSKIFTEVVIRLRAASPLLSIEKAKTRNLKQRTTRRGGWKANDHQGKIDGDSTQIEVERIDESNNELENSTLQQQL